MDSTAEAATILSTQIKESGEQIAIAIDRLTKEIKLIREIAQEEAIKDQLHPLT